jgi:hypothetical protein
MKKTARSRSLQRVLNRPGERDGGSGGEPLHGATEPGARLVHGARTDPVGMGGKGWSV